MKDVPIPLLQYELQKNLGFLKLGVLLLHAFVLQLFMFLAWNRLCVSRSISEENNANDNFMDTYSMQQYMTDEL